MVGLASACAADAGDASKTGEGGAAVTEDGPMIRSDGGGGGVDSAGGGGGTDSSGGGGGGDTGSSDSIMTSGNEGGGEGGSDTGATVLDSGGGADTSTTPDVGAPDTASGHDTGSPPTDAGSGCLSSIPASCPDCATGNASDKPKCQMYITCYIEHSCNPADACGQMDGVCGVNTIGGGSAPQSAAVATYNCACP